MAGVLQPCRAPPPVGQPTVEKVLQVEADLQKLLDDIEIYTEWHRGESVRLQYSYFLYAFLPTVLLTAGQMVLLNDSVLSDFKTKHLFVAMCAITSTVVSGIAGFWKWDAWAAKHDYASKAFQKLLPDIVAAQNALMEDDKPAKQVLFKCNNDLRDIWMEAPLIKPDVYVMLQRQKRSRQKELHTSSNGQAHIAASPQAVLDPTVLAGRTTSTGSQSGATPRRDPQPVGYLYAAPEQLWPVNRGHSFSSPTSPSSEPRYNSRSAFWDEPRSEGRSPNWDSDVESARGFMSGRGELDYISRKRAKKAKGSGTVRIASAVEEISNAPLDQASLSYRPDAAAGRPIQAME